MHFTVSAEIVGTPAEFSERLGSHAYDLVVAEYPSHRFARKRRQLELLHLSKTQIPLIFVGGTLQRETVSGVSLQEAPTIALKWGALVIFL